MRIVFEVEEDGIVTRTVEFDAEPDDTIEAVGRRIASELEVELNEVLDDLGGKGSAPVGHAKKEHRFRHRRVCIDLRFETEEARHFFSPRAHWANVHRWGCKHFQVSHDACANLELRDGDPQGPALNEGRPIGTFEGCKTIWLVKPGAEPNG